MTRATVSGRDHSKRFRDLKIGNFFFTAISVLSVSRFRQPRILALCKVVGPPSPPHVQRCPYLFRSFSVRITQFPLTLMDGEKQKHVVDPFCFRSPDVIFRPRRESVCCLQATGSRDLSSSPGRGHCVAFSRKTLYSHSASLCPGVELSTGKLNAGT